MKKFILGVVVGAGLIISPSFVGATTSEATLAIVQGVLSQLVARVHQLDSELKECQADKGLAVVGAQLGQAAGPAVEVIGQDIRVEKDSNVHVFSLALSGDFTRSKIKVWRPDGTMLAGTGWVVEPRTYHLTDGLHPQDGDYRWEVYTMKGYPNGIESVQAGTFTF